jgi:hypothetical protein
VNVVNCLLGHVISEHGMKPDENKVKAVLNFPKPTNVKEIKSFLELSGYYRKFIKSYSAKAKPITNLLKKMLNSNCQKNVKKLLIH